MRGPPFRISQFGKDYRFTLLERTSRSFDDYWLLPKAAADAGAQGLHQVDNVLAVGPFLRLARA